MSFLIVLKDYLQITEINYLDNMKTKKYWEEQYNTIIAHHHLYNKKGYLLDEFLSLSEDKKLNLLNYYKKKSLLSSITLSELRNYDKYIVSCPDAELCNFLQTEKEEKINSNQIRKEIEIVAKQIRKIRSKFPKLRVLMKDLNSLKKLLEETEKKEREESEERFWTKTMDQFKQSLNK